MTSQFDQNAKAFADAAVAGIETFRQQVASVCERFREYVLAARQDLREKD